MCQERLPGEGGGSSPKNLNKRERKNGQINKHKRKSTCRKRERRKEREGEKWKEGER